MKCQKLFIFVEGEDDRIFFEKIIKPKLENLYQYIIEPILYAEKKGEKISNFIKSINAMKAEYIFFADINSALCIKRKKEDLKNTYREIDEDKIVVVVKSIEGWYLAGLKNSDLAQLKIKLPDKETTDNITKRQFNELIPKRFNSRFDYLIEISKRFSIETAITKNSSFSYFIKKYFSK